MIIKVTDYIAEFLIEKGLNNIFTVVGGGAMHMNDSFGHNPKIHCVYNHHEQASAMAAEGYFRVSGKMGVVCVTSGPGGINAMNGVAGAYMDSVPMLVLSGQMKCNTTTRYTGSKVRSLGTQEFDIVSAVSGMTKFAEMITEPNKIAYYLEKAYYTVLEGRPGPCWLDIPLDIQGALINTDNLVHYEAFDNNLNVLDESIYRDIVEKLIQSKRPVFYAGNGIRIGNALKEFEDLIEKFSLPVVTTWNSLDLIANDNVHFCGRAGIMGDRAGNFAVQNSDFLLCVGTRLGILQVGYDVKTWAREAYTIVVDIDGEELKKTTIRVDLPVQYDAAKFMKELCEYAENYTLDKHEDWINQCNTWKNRYPVAQERHYKTKEKANVYAFIDVLSRKLPERAVTVVANGSASVVGSQTYYIKRGSRFIMNCAISSMGYDLPASIGAAIGAHGEDIYCIAGDGSIMMNLQELQTIITNKLPVKIFIINNEGYHQIRQTQNNIFHNGFVGVGPESGDLGFPEFSKIAMAFGYSYLSVKDNSELEAVIDKVIEHKGCLICEVFVTTDQIFEPKSATKKLPDGTLVSPPLEDLAPFLSREELEGNMFIPLVSE